MKYLLIILMLISVSAIGQNKNAAGMTFKADSAAHVELCYYKYRRAHAYGATEALAGAVLFWYSTTFNRAVKGEVYYNTNGVPLGIYNESSSYAPMRGITRVAGITLVGVGVVTFMRASRWLSKKNLTFTGDKLSYRF